MCTEEQFHQFCASYMCTTSLWDPERFVTPDELNGDFGREGLDPLRHFKHSLFFGDIVAEHDPAFRNSQRRSIEDVRRAVEKAIRFLLFSADDNVYVGAVDAGRRVADAQLQTAHLGFGVAYNAQGLIAEVVLAHDR